MLKQAALGVMYIVFLVILLPAAITFLFGNAGSGRAFELPSAKKPPLSAMNDDETEEYIKGVVAAEMPALFHEEALKAQAVAARTYFSKHKAEYSDISELGQAYISVAGMQNKWGDNFELYYNKISLAVDNTRGEVAIYENEPIEAVFHALSAGKTENSGVVWQEPLPYLISVDSSFDETSPGFLRTDYFSAGNAVDLLKSAFPSITTTPASLPYTFYVNERTEAGYVKNVIAGNLLLTGSEIRNLFGLRSAAFDITFNEEGDTVSFTTKGYGHGAGLSQYGANYLAENGMNYKEIIRYFYHGVSVEKIY